MSISQTEYLSTVFSVKFVWYFGYIAQINGVSHIAPGLPGGRVVGRDGAIVCGCQRATPGQARGYMA